MKLYRFNFVALLFGLAVALFLAQTFHNLFFIILFWLVFGVSIAKLLLIPIGMMICKTIFSKKGKKPIWAYLFNND